MTRLKKPSRSLQLSPLALAMSFALMLPATAAATNYVVTAITENDDDESTTLNEALYLAKNSSDSADTITFHSSVADQVHDLGSHSFSGSGSLSIIGPASGVISINTLYSDDSEGTVLSMNGSELTLSNLEIIANEAQARDGTILKIEEGALTLNNVVLHGEIKKSGANFRQGIHASNADVSLNGSTIHNFQADGQGSALHFLNNGIEASLSLLNSSLSNNGIKGDGVTDSSALFIESYDGLTDIAINASTFENNHFHGGADTASAITLRMDYESDVTFSLSAASTISGNTSVEGNAGMVVRSTLYSFANISILNSTLSENIGKQAGALDFRFSDSEDVAITINNSVFQDNIGEQAASVLHVNMHAWFADLQVDVRNSRVTANGDANLSEKAVLHIETSGDARDLEVAVVNSQFVDNKVQGSSEQAAALNIQSNGVYDTSLLVQNSTFSGNVARQADSVGALALATADSNKAYDFIVDINGSTFNDNVGGAVAALSIKSADFYASAIQITNSTITGNQANKNAIASAIYLASHDNASTYVDIVHVTVVDNVSLGESEESAGIRLSSIGDHMDVFIGNSIIVNNSHAADKEALTYDSEQRDMSLLSDKVQVNVQHSLFGTALAFNAADLDAQLLIDENTIRDKNPELAELAANGGLTATRCLLSYSPALDAGKKRISNDFGLQNDQAGVNRLEDKSPDMGAVEYSLACQQADVGTTVFRHKGSGGLFGALHWGLLLPMLLLVLVRFRVVSVASHGSR